MRRRGVTLNQIPLDGFQFGNRTLTWDLPAGPTGATSGKLVFKSFVDPDVKSPAGPDSYRGPSCAGSLSCLAGTVHCRSRARSVCSARRP